MNTPFVRKATDEATRAAIFSLRYDVCEQLGVFVDTADHARRQLSDEIDEHAANWAIDDGYDRLIGCGRVHFGGQGRFDQQVRDTFDIESFMSIIEQADIAVASRILFAHAGPNLPQLLFMKVMQELVERGIELLVAECEPHLLDMWLRMGFRPYGVSESLRNGPRVRIALVVSDLDHLSEVGSPLLPLARRPRNGFVARRLAARLASDARGGEATRAACLERLARAA